MRAALGRQLQAPQPLSRGTSTTRLGTSVTPHGTRLRLSSPSPPRLPRLPTLLVLSRCLSEEPHFSIQQFLYFLSQQRPPSVPRDSEAFRQRGREQLSLSSDMSPCMLPTTCLGRGSSPQCHRGLPSAESLGSPSGTSSRLPKLPPSLSPLQTPAALLGSHRATMATFTLIMHLPETAPFSAACANLNSFASRCSKPLFSSERNIFSLESKHSHEALHS